MMTLNQVQWNILDSAVASLINSTDLEFFTGKTHITYLRRNSPKPSRRQLTIDPIWPELHPNVVYINNDNHDLLIIQYEKIENYSLSSGAILTIVPTKSLQLTKIFEPFPQLAPKWLNDDLVWVAFADPFWICKDEIDGFKVNIKFHTYNIDLKVEYEPDSTSSSGSVPKLYVHKDGWLDDDYVLVRDDLSFGDKLEPEEEE